MFLAQENQSSLLSFSASAQLKWFGIVQVAVLCPPPPPPHSNLILLSVITTLNILAAIIPAGSVLKVLIKSDKFSVSIACTGICAVSFVTDAQAEWWQRGLENMVNPNVSLSVLTQKCAVSMFRSVCFFFSVRVLEEKKKPPKLVPEDRMWKHRFLIVFRHMTIQSALEDKKQIKNTY